MRKVEYQIEERPADDPQLQGFVYRYTARQGELDIIEVGDQFSPLPASINLNEGDAVAFQMLLDALINLGFSKDETLRVIEQIHTQVLLKSMLRKPDA